MTKEQLEKGNRISSDINILQKFLDEYDVKDDKLSLVLNFINDPNGRSHWNTLSTDISDKLKSFNKDIAIYKKEIADKVILLMQGVLKLREKDLQNL